MNKKKLFNCKIRHSCDGMNNTFAEKINGIQQYLSCLLAKEIKLDPHTMSSDPNISYFQRNIEFICKACQKQSMLSASEYGQSCRTAERINKLIENQEFGVISLIDDEFCRYCHPDASPSFGLKIDYANGKTHIVPKISEDDIDLLADFFSEDEYHNVGRIGRITRVPIQLYAKRIKGLLGIYDEKEEFIVPQFPGVVD